MGRDRVDDRLERLNRTSRIEEDLRRQNRERHEIFTKDIFAV